MFRRLFPNLASALDDWPKEKWIAFPAVAVISYSLLVAIVQDALFRVPL